MKRRLLNVLVKPQWPFIIASILLMTLFINTSGVVPVAGKADNSKTGNMTDRTIRPRKSIDLKKVFNLNMDEFVFKHFSNPDSFYWPGYFWKLQDVITEDIISKQLEDLASHGANVTPHPMPQEFRPLTQPTLMAPDYMTSAFLINSVL